LEGILVRYVGQFRAFGNADPHAVTQRVHETLDAVILHDRSKDRSSRDIQCAKGCHHCCKAAVEVFPHEASLLVQKAREAAIELDRDLLERQSRHGIESWNAQSAAEKTCVFLGADGACKVYEFRPNACRMLLVVTEPVLCDADRHPPDSVGRWISWEAQILGSAALDVFGAQLMPKALLAAMQATEGSPPE
jgi:Fe-S-cluster containining protein